MVIGADANFAKVTSKEEGAKSRRDSDSKDDWLVNVWLINCF